MEKITGKTSRELAMKLEGEARERDFAAKFNKEDIDYGDYEHKTAVILEKAGDEWVKQYAKITKPYILVGKDIRKLLPKPNMRDLKNILEYAVSDYESATKKAPKETKRLGKKIESVKKISSKIEIKTGIEKKLYGFISITALAFALFFVGFNLTGNVIGGINLNDSRLIGLAFFIFGLVFAFVYLQGKKRF